MRWTAVGCDDRRRCEGGFTLIELLVTIVILSIASVAMYQILFSVVRSTGRTEAQARISDEGRLGFNRMVRDTREGREIIAVGDDLLSYTVAVDFDADGVITNAPSKNASGDYEQLTYSFEPASGRVRLNGELLMTGVECEASCSSTPVFGFTSEDLRYDWNSNGVTTWQELDAAPQYGVVGVGNDNGKLDGFELARVSSVTIRMRVVKDDLATTFYARAQLRNNRV